MSEIIARLKSDIEEYEIASEYCDLLTSWIEGMGAKTIHPTVGVRELGNYIPIPEIPGFESAIRDAVTEVLTEFQLEQRKKMEATRKKLEGLEK